MLGGWWKHVWEKKMFFCYCICLHKVYDSDMCITVNFSLMQVKSGTIFDNFLITNDPNLAEEVGNETWGTTKVSPKLLPSGFKNSCWVIQRGTDK